MRVDARGCGWMRTSSAPRPLRVEAHFAHLQPESLCKPGPNRAGPAAFGPTSHTPHPLHPHPICVGAHITHLQPESLCKPGPNRETPSAFGPTLVPQYASK